jgi:hypothetical protein
MQSDVEAIEAVAEWLKDLGLGNGSDRLHKYICEIRKQAAATTIEEVTRLGFVHLQASEFTDVWRAYKGAENPRLIAKLERALKGCDTLAEESPQNSDPRNTMFELALAAGLKLRGIDVELGEPTDLIINFPSGQYILEGKRPFRESSVRANVKDAAHQLRTNLRPDQHGVIAISLSRIINPGTKLLYAVVGDRDKEGAVHGTLHAHLDHKCSELMSALATIDFSPNIAALMFDMSTPALTEKGETIVRGCRVYPADEPKVIDGKLRRFRTPLTSPFVYFDKAFGEALDKKFSLETQAEIDRMNYLAQMRLGVATSKYR